jgi:hypothetical protein
LFSPPWDLRVTCTGFLSTGANQSALLLQTLEGPRIPLWHFSSWSLAWSLNCR